MAVERICVLSRQAAIDAIKDTECVMYRHGVWNKYYINSTPSVINSIQGSGYGADVDYNTDTKMYYVSIPCDADMW